MKVRSWVDKEVVANIIPFIEEAKFPGPILDRAKELNIYQHFLKPPYGKLISHKGMGAVVAEFARGDASVATALLVQWGLAMYTIESLGSEEQKAKYLPRMKAL